MLTTDSQAHGAYVWKQLFLSLHHTTAVANTLIC